MWTASQVKYCVVEFRLPFSVWVLWVLLRMALAQHVSDRKRPFKAESLSLTTARSVFAIVTRRERCDRGLLYSANERREHYRAQ